MKIKLKSGFEFVLQDFITVGDLMDIGLPEFGLDGVEEYTTADLMKYIPWFTELLERTGYPDAIKIHFSRMIGLMMHPEFNKWFSSLFGDLDELDEIEGIPDDLNLPSNS